MASPLCPLLSSGWNKFLKGWSWLTLHIFCSHIVSFSVKPLGTDNFPESIWWEPEDKCSHLLQNLGLCLTFELGHFNVVVSTHNQTLFQENESHINKQALGGDYLCVFVLQKCRNWGKGLRINLGFRSSSLLVHSRPLECNKLWYNESGLPLVCVFH